MKPYKYLLGLFIFILFITGCAKNGQDSLLLKEEKSSVKEESISYKIEQVALSKGFQSTEPNVEVVKKGLRVNLLISLGLLESGQVNIERIAKVGNEVNIYTSNEVNTRNPQLVVPQIIVNLRGSKLRNLDDLKFNIVNEDYKPIKIKFGLNEIINKIESEFKVSSNSFPKINLTNKKDTLLWDITYSGIFDKDNPETPLIDLSLQIDANTGEVIEYTKNFISSYIDEGKIIDYVDNKYILYVKKEVDLEGNNSRENLWYYDIEENERQMIYSSGFKISSAIISPDHEYISLIESTETNNELYIISKTNPRALKILFQDLISPSIIRWKDEENLYIVDNSLEDNSIIYNYDVMENTTDIVANLNKTILGLRIGSDNFLISEYNNGKTNLKISSTKDWSNFRFIDFGLNPKFVNEDKISYLKNNDKDDTNVLHIYDICSFKNYYTINLNISNYEILPDDSISVIERNANNIEFTLHKYKIDTMRKKTIANINTDKVFYNTEKETLYLDLIIPFESDKSEIIYSLDLRKL